MTPERWSRLRDLFGRAVALSARQRADFVSRACECDAGLERSLLALLEHHDQSEGAGRPVDPSSPDFARLALGVLRTFAPGDLVAGRFRIERFLAEGGMGEVYVADDLELGEQVALKTILPEVAEDDETLSRFKAEVQLARRVTHSNVARVFDLFRHEFTFDGARRTIVFLSMELLEGETLAARLRRVGKLSPDEARSIALQLLAGVDAAHSAGVTHGDLKSSNVLLARAKRAGCERAVIMDFGLANRTNVVDVRLGGSGTPAYMAPEQVEGGTATPAADIYSLGIVFFEMIAGTVPFRGPTPRDTAERRLAVVAPALDTVVPGTPSAWTSTVRACLQREPGRRPVSVREIEARLTGRFHFRRRVRFAAATAAIVGAATAGILWIQRPHQPNDGARAAFDTARVKLSTLTRAGFLGAIADYERATRLDPKWAEPWAEMAYTYANAANTQQISPTEARRQAKAAALTALTLDPRSTKAFGALGWVQSLDFDEWPAAEANLRRAINQDPADGRLHYWLAVHLRKKGRFGEAEAEVREALRLSERADPSVWCELAFLFWTAGQLDRMSEYMKELLVAHPNFGLSRFLHARLLKELGQFSAAEEELAFSERLQYSRVTVLVERASLEAYRGNVTEARAILANLEELAKSQPVDTLLIAGVHAKLGETDRALAWLEQGYGRGDNTLLSIKTSPVLEPLRSTTRFRALLVALHYIEE